MIKIFISIPIYFFFIILLIGCSGPMQVPEYNSALAAYDQGKYQTSITFINRAIEIDNNQSNYYLLRAKANYKVGNKKLAMDDLNRSLGLERNFEALYLKGKLYLEDYELEKAKESFRAAYELNPVSADLLFDLGYLEYLNGENQVALEYYTNASKYDSTNSAVFVNIGNLYAMMGNSEMAIENYSTALTLGTTDGIAYYNRANEKMIMGDIKGAIDDYKNYLIIDSTNISTLYILAEAQTHINNVTGALESYDKIIKLDSSSAKAYYLKGTGEISLKMNDQACSNFKKAGDLGYFQAYEMIKKYCEPKQNTKKKVNKKSKR